MIKITVECANLTKAQIVLDAIIKGVGTYNGEIYDGNIEIKELEEPKETLR